VIFSARRKQGKPPTFGAKSPIVVIESHDLVFAEKIAKALNQWGLRHQAPGGSSELLPSTGEVTVTLLDIRELAEGAYGLVYSTKQLYPDSEAVLINKPDNVVASIAGMKAGAADEIIVPFDIGTLKKIIFEASERAQTARANKRKKPLLARFSEAMMAATFAQAGDFTGALDILDDPAPPPIDTALPNTKE